MSRSHSDEGGAGAKPPPANRRYPSAQVDRKGAVRAGGPALEGMYQLLLWLIPTLEKFPRSQKFLLGDRLQSEALTVLDHLVTATFTREREGALRAANLGLERMRYGVRLAMDLRYLNLKGYEYASRAIDGVGRLVGGWIRSDQSNAARADSGSSARA